MIQADLKTGKTVKIHQLHWGGGAHGVTFAPQTQTLWITALSISAVVEVDPKDFRILRIRPAKGDRPHGLDFYNGALWVLVAATIWFRKSISTRARCSNRHHLADGRSRSARDVHPRWLYAPLRCRPDGAGSGSEPAQVCRFKLT